MSPLLHRPLVAAATTALVAGSVVAGQPALAQPRAAAVANAPAIPIDLQKGVAVVAAGPVAVDAAWALAQRVYADPLLRPVQLDDATARVLAGEPAAAGASPKMRELAEARKAINPLEPSAARLAGTISAELGGASQLLVHMPAPGQARARLYAATTRTWLMPELWQQPDASGAPSWEAAVAWLRGHALASRAQPPARAPASRTVLASGWFWGALGAAAAVAVVAVAVARDEGSNAVHVQGRLGP
jgi:hypothetical protein